MSLRGIGRILGVVHQSVVNWIAAPAATVPADPTDHPSSDMEGDDTVEMDELAIFIEGKSQPISVTVAVARGNRLIVGQRVIWTVDLGAMQPFADALPAVGRYCTDGAAVCGEVIWPEEAWHGISIAKEETYIIEGINAGCPRILEETVLGEREDAGAHEATTAPQRVFPFLRG